MGQLPLFRRGWKKSGKKFPPYVRTWVRNYPTMTHYSKNFSRKELDCKCGCKTPKHIEVELTNLAYDLEKLREAHGGPISILSAYRCSSRNRIIGGASNSQHMYGKAADLLVPKGQQKKYVASAEKVPAFRNGGIGVYPNGGVHVDRRGYVARWDSF